MQKPRQRLLSAMVVGILNHLCKMWQALTHLLCSESHQRLRPTVLDEERNMLFEGVSIETAEYVLISI